jgi:isoleucyl-tRNA synthetase
LGRALAHTSAGRTLPPDLVEIVKDELNVKALDFVSEASALVDYRILPDNKQLGPKFGARFPAVRAALAALDPTRTAAAVEAREPVPLSVDGETVLLQADEILVQTQPAEGLAVAADRLATVAVDTVLTSELRTEGLARELVRRIQDLRKQADFNIEDRITLYYQTDSSDLASVLDEGPESWRAYIQAETLATQVKADKPSPAAYVETLNVEGSAITLGVER